MFFLAAPSALLALILWGAEYYFFSVIFGAMSAYFFYLMFSLDMMDYKESKKKKETDGE